MSSCWSSDPITPDSESLEGCSTRQSKVSSANLKINSRVLGFSLRLSFGWYLLDRQAQTDGVLKSTAFVAGCCLFTSERSAATLAILMAFMLCKFWTVTSQCRKLYEEKIPWVSQELVTVQAVLIAGQIQHNLSIIHWSLPTMNNSSSTIYPKLHILRSLTFLSFLLSMTCLMSIDCHRVKVDMC